MDYMRPDHYYHLDSFYTSVIFGTYLKSDENEWTKKLKLLLIGKNIWRLPDGKLPEVFLKSSLFWAKGQTTVFFMGVSMHVLYFFIFIFLYLFLYVFPNCFYPLCDHIITSISGIMSFLCFLYTYLLTLFIPCISPITPLFQL